jgi:hypothetical protein
MFSGTRRQVIITSALTMALGASAYSGNVLRLELSDPTASTDPAAKGAIAVARAVGCGEPSKVIVTATAEGLVNGERKSIPLEAVALSTPGSYAFKGNVPAEGYWVLSAAGSYKDLNSGAVAPISANRFNRTLAKYMPRHPVRADIDPMLHGMAAPKQAAAR